MNAFEQIVSGLFRGKGYWTIVGYWVELTKAEKVRIGKPSMPRPELDILAYKGSINELIWIECKSFLDSQGVRFSSFTNPDDPGYERYKVFNYQEYRDVITDAIKRQATKTGLTQPEPKIKYCLVAGKTHSDKDRNQIAAKFGSQGWLFYDETWLASEFDDFAKYSYEDDVAMIVAKILNRKSKIA